ncbi:MAG: 3-hydroxyacyl-CoA dehydrogenase/enoyl-CoA hydratase family protein [Deferrisomatales bacterium]|nr:3-hydroxyacyl-CoA dehydrogenase/enoyl-CoA hydratase family protein [Deferrisomatales bacterium]
MPIRKSAVLGAGVMGSAIAAHLANAGIPTVLLDIVPREPTDEENKKGLDLSHPLVRNRLARDGIQKALKASPAAFGHRDRAALVTPGNLEDDLPSLSEVDWVVEAVVERLDIKTALFARLVPHLKPGCLLTTNTSGLSVNAMAEALPERLRPRFFGTHFFNPPRYMHLMELVPASGTDRAALEAFARFAEDRLGKGVVYAKDTPNFIANRVGVFSVLYTLRAMEDHGLAVEQVDALTGKALARPKSATFRTADLVGLDVLAHVARTQYEGAPDDERRDVFRLPPWLDAMVQKGLLGQKSGGGFYKRVKQGGKKETLAIDPATGEYRPKGKADFPSLAEAKGVEDPGRRAAKLLGGKDAGARFAWDVTAETLLYAARRIPSVAGDVPSIDRAMRWGFGWEIGPFELWDALGVKASVERMTAEGREVPEGVAALAASPEPAFYLREGTRTRVWDPVSKAHVSMEERPRVVALADLKAAGRKLFSNPEATLVDLGDGVACLEFHSKMNAIGGGILQAIQKTVAEAGSSYQALVIGNQGENFSVGANLMLLLFEALEGNLPEVDAMVRAFQEGTMALKYAPVPVVAAPFGRVLGGGAEVCLHAHRVQASHETYMGLVEVGVGLLPAGGGTKELLLRAMAHVPTGTGADPLPWVRKAFEAIGMAKVSLSAWEAFDLGLLRAGDSVSMNPEHLILDAKRAALDLLETGWQPMQRPAKVPVMGRDGLANIRSMLHNMVRGRQISEHDALVGEKVGWVLCGGEVDNGTVVDEDYLLTLERRAFVELCGQRKTLERIQHILKTGKPLRN